MDLCASVNNKNLARRAETPHKMHNNKRQMLRVRACSRDGGMSGCAASLCVLPLSSSLAALSLSRSLEALLPYRRLAFYSDWFMLVFVCVVFVNWKHTYSFSFQTLRSHCPWFHRANTNGFMPVDVTFSIDVTTPRACQQSIQHSPNSPNEPIVLV